jgi:hypothetical protein
MGVIFVGLIIVFVTAALIAWVIQRKDQDNHSTDDPIQPMHCTSHSGEVSKNRDDEDDGPDSDEIADLVSELVEDFEQEDWLRYSVTGESQRNPNGGDRQEILRRLRARLDTEDSLEPRLIRLIREPRNRYDPNAISVSCVYGQVGFISREDAIALAPLLDSGRPIYACVDKLLGGDPGRPSIGIWLRLSTLADFGAAREAEEREVLKAEREEWRIKKEAVRLAKLAAREQTAALKRKEREAAAALKKQERESARAARAKPKPNRDNKQGSEK